jgi:hypothetical protein
LIVSLPELFDEVLPLELQLAAHHVDSLCGSSASELGDIEVVATPRGFR